MLQNKASGEKASRKTPPGYFPGVRNHRPDAISQDRTLPSRPVFASDAPSDEKARSITPS
jgi:hypothetical protein